MPPFPDNVIDELNEIVPLDSLQLTTDTNQDFDIIAEYIRDSEDAFRVFMQYVTTVNAYNGKILDLFEKVVIENDVTIARVMLEEMHDQPDIISVLIKVDRDVDVTEIFQPAVDNGAILNEYDLNEIATIIRPEDEFRVAPITFWYSNRVKIAEAIANANFIPIQLNKRFLEFPMGTTIQDPKQMYLNVLLSSASAHNNTPIVRLALDSGADVHFNNEEPIYNAVSNLGTTRRQTDWLEILSLLIEHGADVNARDNEILWLAVIAFRNGNNRNGSLDVVKLLLDSHAGFENNHKSISLDWNHDPRLRALLVEYLEPKRGFGINLEGVEDAVTHRPIGHFYYQCSGDDTHYFNESTIIDLRKNKVYNCPIDHSTIENVLYTQDRQVRQNQMSNISGRIWG